MNIREAAADLETALDLYLDRAAGMDDVEATAIANILSDRWGSFRFYCAMNALMRRGSVSWQAARKAAQKAAR